jgi:hypothetical protein
MMAVGRRINQHLRGSALKGWVTGLQRPMPALKKATGYVALGYVAPGETEICGTGIGLTGARGGGESPSQWRGRVVNNKLGPPQA